MSYHCIVTPIAAEWIAKGRGFALPREFSVAFNRYLHELPWLASSLDWSRMPPGVTLDVSSSTAPEFGRWLDGTRIGKHSYIAVWYSVPEGGVVVPIGSVTAETLDALYWGAPGIRFSFGIDMRDHAVEPSYGDLIEYGNGDVLVAVSR